MNPEKVVLKIIQDIGLSSGEINEMVEKKVATLKGILIEEALLVITKELAVTID